MNRTERMAMIEAMDKIEHQDTLRRTIRALCSEIDAHEHGAASLRDTFAAMALQGMLADPNHTEHFDDVADDAFKYADAMMARRAE